MYIVFCMMAVKWHFLIRTTSAAEPYRMGSLFCSTGRAPPNYQHCERFTGILMSPGWYCGLESVLERWELVPQ